jgi:hypothetical protein
MIERPFQARPLVRPLVAAGVALAVAAGAASAQNPVPTPAPATLASVHGTAVDSVHGELLVGALVRVEGTNREAMTDSTGRYRIEGVPPGQHRLVILHPVLDTLGIGLVTPNMNFAGGESALVDVAIPSAETIVGLFCTPARRALGPAALVGFIRDADTGAPAEGAKVSLLFYESDPLGLKKAARVREAVIGKDGGYRLCGLPGTLTGKLQVFRGGVSSGEVPVELNDSFLALRSMSISSTATVIAAAPNDSGKRPPPRILGSAKLTGRVVTKAGQPLVGARVGLQGMSAATLTKANGEFTMDSLPSGTQTLEVRQLGYSPTEVAVELSAAQPHRVQVQMSDYVPVLQTMRVTAQREKGLMDVGFNDRKRSSSGFFLDADALAQRKSTQFSDVLRTVPGIRVQPAGNGQQVVTSSRDPMGGCVNFWVDGAQWQQQYPGDLDTFVRPEEVAAVEVYSSTTVPAQFSTAGGGSCTTVVVWTERRINRKR